MSEEILIALLEMYLLCLQKRKENQKKSPDEPSLEEKLNAHRTTKNGRGHNKEKHQKGLDHKKMGMMHTEKGDKSRTRRNNPKKRK